MRELLGGLYGEGCHDICKGWEANTMNKSHSAKEKSHREAEGSRKIIRI